jgi:hypothetical protein
VIVEGHGGEWALRVVVSREQSVRFLLRDDDRVPPRLVAPPM